jgi:subtilisin
MSRDLQQLAAIGTDSVLSAEEIYRTFPPCWHGAPGAAEGGSHATASFVSLTLTAMLVTTVSVSGVRAAPRVAAATGRYIVVLNDSVSVPGEMAAEHARTTGARVRRVYRSALKGYSATLSADRLAALRADPRVAYVAVDRPVHTSGQVLPTGIDRVDAEKSSARSGDGRGAVDVDVAVLDTGIDTDHPDLNVAGGINCVGGSSFDDDHLHGTHVAGTVGAKTTMSGLSAWPRGHGCGRSRWSTRPAAAPSSRSSAAWTG